MRDWLEEVRRRLEAAELDGAAERDIAEEVAQHLEDRHAELRSRGVTEAEARAQVLSELGEDDALGRLVGEVVRARPEALPVGRSTPGEILGGVGADVRLAARMLRRAPFYAGFAVFVIALGVGANTAIFTVLDSVLLRPPTGVAEPERLASIYTSDYSGPRFGATSYPDVLELGEAEGVFDDVAAYSLRTISMVGDGWTARELGEVVTADYFRVLGVRPAAGRFFSPEETEPGRMSQVAVIGHDLWRRHFEGRADAVGSTISVMGQPLTVIGVAPPDFSGSMHGLGTRVWLPVGAPREILGFDPMHRGNRGFLVRARLPDGLAVPAAQEALNVVAARLHAEYPEEWTDVDNRSRVFTILPESEARVPPSMKGAVVGILGAAMAAMLVLLLIACTNVANLMLSRSTARRAEMGVRIALGATRGRIARHLLAESLLLALAGGAGGVVLAYWLMRLLQTVRIPGLHVTIQIGMDWRVLAYATAVTLATGLLFGLAPALQASGAPAPLIRDDPPRGRRLRLRETLIVVQVASSLVLLTTGGLLLRSLGAMRGADTGYAADDVVIANFDLGLEGYSPERAAAFYDAVSGRVAALAATESLTLAEQVPLGLGWSRRRIHVEGYQPAAGEDMEFPGNRVGPGWFRTMGMALVRGRDFTTADRAGAAPVIIVSEAFARRFWPGQDAIGQRVGLLGTDGPYAEVIGIAPDAKYRSVDEEPQPYFYFPYLQHPATDMTLIARGRSDPGALAAAVRAAAREAAPTLPPPTVRTFRDHLSLARLPQRMAALVLSALGLLAVSIAVVGLYGLVAFTVARRAREFGIRVALGAGAGEVRRLVLGGTLRLTAIGIAFGAPVAVAAAVLMRPVLMTSPVDPVPFLGVPALLALSALLAGHAPARRAARQDPAVVLRAD